MRKLVYVGGVLCLVFGIFHVLLWPLADWPAALAYMKPGDRMLMQTFNFCITPVFFVLAWAYLRHADLVLTSALGRPVAAVPAVIFAFRSLAEPVFGGLATTESWFFFVLCAVVALVFVAPMVVRPAALSVASPARS